MDLLTMGMRSEQEVADLLGKDVKRAAVKQLNEDYGDDHISWYAKKWTPLDDEARRRHRAKWPPQSDTSMDTPRPMTKLGAFNRLIMQWTGFRLARVVNIDLGRQTHWAVVGPVLPLTGWGSKYIGNPTVRLQFKTLDEWIEDKTVK